MPDTDKEPEMTMPARKAFAHAARAAIERHDEWDSLHCFVTLHQEGDGVRMGTYAAIDPGIAPQDYPDLMAGLVRKQHDEDPHNAPCGFLLQIEAFGAVQPGKDATAEERLRFDADRMGRTFHQRADSYETAAAWVADVRGRLWCAAKRRDEPGKVREEFYPPGPKQPGGQMIRGLLAVAHATGMLAWGLPGPVNLTN